MKCITDHSNFKEIKRPYGIYRTVCFVALILFLLIPVASASDYSDSKNVLILFSLESGMPMSDLIYNNIKSTILREFKTPVNFYVEYLDMGRFPYEWYHRHVFDLFRKKYAEKKIDVFITIDHGVHNLIKKYGEGLFSQYPMITIELAHRDTPLPSFSVANSTGVLLDFDLKRLLESSLSIHPGTTAVYVISGESPLDKVFETLARQEYHNYENGVKINYLTGLTMNELLEKTSNLPPTSLIIYLTMQSDTKGDFWYPRESLRIISENANVPVYGFVDTFMGYGAVGGYMLSLDRVGLETGKLALRVIKGEQPDAIPFVQEGLSLFMYDWRQLKRWNISEQNLPDGSVVLYKDVSFFEKNKWLIIAIVLFFIIESIIIIMLIRSNRKQKKTALELVDARQRYKEILHAERTSRLGELTASLAHELNQPLTAIRSSAQAALRFIKSDNVDLQLFMQILENIVEDDKRASAIIVNIRSLVNKETIKKEPVNLYILINNTISIYRSQALFLGIVIKTELEESLPKVVANRTQLQQVLLNLIINASEAMSDTPPEKKRIILHLQTTDGFLKCSVRDFGRGIESTKTNDIFNPFYTTKSEGMGMGMAVTKSIILSHKGDIWAENNIDGGATITFKLPILKND